MHSTEGRTAFARYTDSCSWESNHSQKKDKIIRVNISYHNLQAMRIVVEFIVKCREIFEFRVDDGNIKQPIDSFHNATAVNHESTASNVLRQTSFNHLKRSGVRLLHFEVFSAIQV